MHPFRELHRPRGDQAAATWPGVKMLGSRRGRRRRSSSRVATRRSRRGRGGRGGARDRSRSRQGRFSVGGSLPSTTTSQALLEELGLVNEDTPGFEAVENGDGARRAARPARRCPRASRLGSIETCEDYLRGARRRSTTRSGRPRCSEAERREQFGRAAGLAGEPGTPVLRRDSTGRSSGARSRRSATQA